MDAIVTLWTTVSSAVLAAAQHVGRLLLVLIAILPAWIAAAVAWVAARRHRPAPTSHAPAGRRPRILFICGTINHTTQLHQIARELPDFEHAFTWYYCDGILEVVRRLGVLRNTALGDKLRARCLAYLEKHRLPIDLDGRAGGYDLVLTCSDLTIPKNVSHLPIVQVQEGMTDPEDLYFHLVRALRLPPWLVVSSATTGLSDGYRYFCVASEGYRELFIKKGVRRDKLIVTGIPNFDDCQRYRRNTFPHRGYVLVCSSDLRETARYENRPKFIRRVVRIAGGREIIWKLHPNENVARARAELARHAPEALVLDSGSAEEMIANCDALVTQYSSTAYVGLALGKEVHSFFDVAELRRLCPLQHASGAKNIAALCRRLLAAQADRREVVTRAA